MAHGLVKGPDRMWYLNRGVLGPARSDRAGVDRPRQTPMKVAFHLRRRPEPEPASAVLLETDRVEAVLDLAARLGPDRSPPIHRVAGGFLVKLGEGVEPPAGPIRLRRLAENLYLPVDADLVPALLDDEAAGLTRDRGLIFLPGGRVLGLRPGPARCRSRPGDGRPSRGRATGGRSRIGPRRADRLREITLEPPRTGRARTSSRPGGDAGRDRRRRARPGPRTPARPRPWPAGRRSGPARG